MPAKVQALEYDPNRTANLALVAYTNGEKKYILAPEGLKVGDTIFASNKATTNDFIVGNNFPLAPHSAVDARALRRTRPWSRCKNRPCRRHVLSSSSAWRMARPR